MSLIKDAISAMKEVIVLSEKVDQVGSLLSEISKEVREHDRRLIRIETMVEMTKTTKLIEKNRTK